jgi:multisubunit Na+/H+ antiporter MnhB subunit
MRSMIHRLIVTAIVTAGVLSSSDTAFATESTPNGGMSGGTTISFTVLPIVALSMDANGNPVVAGNHVEGLSFHVSDITYDGGLYRVISVD